MWVTNPHLAQGIELGRAWGFEYRTVAFVWDKMVHNPGQYTMSYCELCLVFKRGRIPLYFSAMKASLSNCSLE